MRSDTRALIESEVAQLLLDGYRRTISSGSLHTTGWLSPPLDDADVENARRHRSVDGHRLVTKGTVDYRAGASETVYFADDGTPYGWTRRIGHDLYRKGRDSETWEHTVIPRDTAIPSPSPEAASAEVVQHLQTALVDVTLIDEDCCLVSVDLRELGHATNSDTATMASALTADDVHTFTAWVSDGYLTQERSLVRNSDGSHSAQTVQFHSYGHANSSITTPTAEEIAHGR